MNSRGKNNGNSGSRLLHKIDGENEEVRDVFERFKSGGYMAVSDGNIISKDPRRDFHLEEWKALRAEIVEQGKKYDQLKISLLGGLGFYYGWAIEHVLDYKKYECINHSFLVSIMIFIIPIAVCHIAKTNASYFSFYFDVAGNYIRSLERMIGLEEYGWQGAWFKSQGLPYPVKEGGNFKGDFYWKAIVVFVYLVPVLLFAALFIRIVPYSVSHSFVQVPWIDQVQCAYTEQASSMAQNSPDKPRSYP